ncbi:type-F conjugative transfer system protein TraW [Nitrosomonas mobilis]|nr:type-F conjugative transfer system protein TraW [Nitrosomonas mobilis]HNO76193.1 type-F conjugative transfer system protein TraW [Nitrosomonas mobilis]
MRHIHMLACCLLVLLVGQLMAEDLDVIGPTYPIQERDLIEAMQTRFKNMEKSGELADLEENYKKQVISGIERPQPVAGISTSGTNKTFYVDLSFTLDRDVVDEHGRVMFKAGFKVNPLDYIGFGKILVFFNSDNKREKAFVERYIKSAEMPVKPILIAGAPLELMREWQREVFFDQGGALSKRFKITHSPSTVRQEGKRLRIDEIRL